MCSDLYQKKRTLIIGDFEGFCCCSFVFAFFLCLSFGDAPFSDLEQDYSLS